MAASASGFECVIPNKFVKIFSKSIQLLSKVAEDVFIEAASRKLVLRTLNASRSAFLALTMDAGSFFDAYSLPGNVPAPAADAMHDAAAAAAAAGGDADMLEPGQQQQQQSKAGVAASTTRKLQVKVKACQAALRQPAGIERCTVRADEQRQRLLFELDCSHGARRVYAVALDDTGRDVGKAVYRRDPHLCSRLVIAPKRLQECLANFHTDHDEIVLSLTPDQVRLKVWIEPESEAKSNGSGGGGGGGAKDKDKPKLRTELCIDARDFDVYDCRRPDGTHVMFCARELRAMLAFCEAINQPLEIWVQESGRPVVVSVDYFNVFSAELVLATLLEPTAAAAAGSSCASSSAADSAAAPSSGQSLPSQQQQRSASAAATPSSVSSAAAAGAGFSAASSAAPSPAAAAGRRHHPPVKPPSSPLSASASSSSSPASALAAGPAAANGSNRRVRPEGGGGASDSSSSSRLPKQQQQQQPTSRRGGDGGATVVRHAAASSRVDDDDELFAAPPPQKKGRKLEPPAAAAGPPPGVVSARMQDFRPFDDSEDESEDDAGD